MKKILLGLCLIFISRFAWAETDLRLEGVVMDHQRPDQSIATINGEPLQAGSRIGDYVLLQVKPNSVIVKNQKTGEEHQLLPSGAPKIVSNEELPVQPVSLMDKVKNFITDPKKASAQAANRMWELKAIRDLALINNAAVIYYNQNSFFPRNIRQMTLAGHLDKKYEEKVIGKYTFYLSNTTHPDDLQIHADPVEPSSGLRFFFVGVDAVIRESYGKPASKESPVHDYPGRIK